MVLLKMLRFIRFSTFPLIFQVFTCILCRFSGNCLDFSILGNVGNLSKNLSEMLNVQHFSTSFIFSVVHSLDFQGYFAEHIEPKKNHKFPSMHYLRLNPPGGSSGKPVHLYTEDGAEASRWLEALELSAQTVSIRKFYSLGEVLGKGSFAEVQEATEKATGRKVAVKIIEKKVIDGKQKEYIRIEMSVMKLVRHPNVMRLEQVFETKSKIYMVMPLYLGGDLYEYMKHNARSGLKEVCSVKKWRGFQAF